MEFSAIIHPLEKIPNSLTKNEKARFKKYIEEKDDIIINLLNEVTTLGKTINSLTEPHLENLSFTESVSLALEK